MDTPHVESPVHCAGCGEVYCCQCHDRCPSCNDIHIMPQPYVPSLPVGYPPNYPYFDPVTIFN